MKIVAVSDLHLDKETLGVPRAPEVERCLWQAAEHAVAIDADAFLFLGDLADPDSGGATFRAIETAVRVALFLDERRMRSIWLGGNHDCLEDGTGATTLSPLRALSDGNRQRILVVEDPGRAELGDLSFVFLPYAPVARAYDPAKAARQLIDEARGRVVVASHLNIPGIGPGEETLELPRGREVWLPLEETARASFRMSGHYHTRQDFDPGDGGPPIHVVGSPTAFSFGPEAEGTPAFSVVTL